MKKYRVVLSVDNGESKIWVEVYADDAKKAQQQVLSNIVFINTEEIAE